MSDKDKFEGPVGSLPRTKGQSLVEAFRLARISQRPTLRTQLQVGRVELRQSRAIRLGRKLPSAPPVPPEREPETGGLAEPAAPPASPVVESVGSIFAGFCGAIDVQAEVRGADVTMPHPDAEPDPEPEPDSEPETAGPETTQPLSAIGFGPGMTIRMRQLGIETVSQLASSDPDWLRTALGDISQLINVDVWIDSARKAAGTPH